MLDEEQRIAIIKLHRALFKSFEWARTPQGFEYWSEVAKNLLELAGECPVCGVHPDRDQ